MLKKSFLTLTFVVFGCMVAGCRPATLKHVNWMYTIPDDYEGWIAIQFNCENGNPLEEDDGVIEVVFGSNGLFCTSDSQFLSNGQISARNQSDISIPFYLDNRGQSGYGVCCWRSISSQRIIEGNEINIDAHLMWVGNMEIGPPEIDTFFESIRD